MFLTGRAVLLLGVGVLPVVLLTSLAGGSAGVAWAAAGAWSAAWVLVLAGDVALAASVRRLRFDREHAARARAGEQVPYALTVTNPTARTARLTIRDAWEPTAGFPLRIQARVPAGERRQIDTMMIPRRRGERRSDFLAARSLGPLRLAGRQRRIDSTTTLRVLPPFHARRHLPSRIARLRELDGSASVHVRGEGTEFDSLREYVRGDDVRSIDWRATARARTTMLRTWRPERDRHVVILVDSGRTSAGRVGDQTRLDSAMEGALLLSALADQAGDRVHVLLFDRIARARVSGPRGADLLASAVDAMALVEPQLIDTDWEAALTESTRLARRPALVVVITAADSVDAGRSLLAAIAPLAARTRTIVASVTDGALDELAHRRSDTDELWAAAAAERELWEAARVRDALRRAGADALSAGPDEIPPLIADRYLALKAAGRL